MEAIEKIELRTLKKENTMGKLIKLTLALAFIFTITMAPVQKAEAAIGAIAGATTAVTGGGVVAASSTGVWGGTWLSHNYIIITLAAFILVPLAAIGLLVLDDETSIVYEQLSDEQAQNLGVSPKQQMIFNAEIDEVNAVREMVEAEVAQLEKEEANLVPGIWDQYREDISSEYFEVLEAISTQIQENAI